MVDKKDDANLVSIFNNLNLHAKPMDSSTKNGMEPRRDLEVHRKNGGEEQKRMGSIQQNSFSVQEKQPYLQQSQWTSKTNNIESEWGQDHYSNPMGCSLLPVHDQFMFFKENFKEKNGINLSAPRPNLSMDNYNGTQTQQATSNSQCFLEIEPGKDYQLCVWCINYGLQFRRQGKFMYTSAKERPLSSSPGSVWKCDSFTRRLGIRELLGDECLDFFMPVETRSPNQVSNNISIQKRNEETMRKLPSYSEMVDTLKNDRKFREFHGPTDEWLIDQEYMEYFNETYGITCIHPLLVDHSGMVVLFFDDRGIMFKWSEMTKDMHVLGINIMEGLANYLYHPEKMCAIMEDTGELVPRVELIRRIKEKMAKEELEKEKLAKERKLAKEKKLAKQKLAKQKLAKQK